MNFLEELQAKYGQQVAQQVTAKFGLDPAQAADILPRMAPYVLGGVQSQMAHPEDHQSAQRVLESQADESALEDVEGHFDRTSAQSNDSLAGLFGDHAPAAHEAMAHQLGVSKDMIGKLLPVLAPLILGQVMSKMKSGGRSSSAGGGGGAMEVLGAILGQQGGGSNILGSVLGSVLGGGGNTSGGGNTGGGLANKAGCISMILGRLLGGK